MYPSIRRLPLRFRLLFVAASAMAFVGLAIVLVSVGSLLITGVTSGDLGAGLMGAVFLLVLIVFLFVPIPMPEKSIPREALERWKDQPSDTPKHPAGALTVWRHVRNFLDKVTSLSVQDWERISDRYAPLTGSVLAMVRRELPRWRARRLLRKLLNRTGRLVHLHTAYGIVWELVVEGTVPSTLRATEAILMGCEALLFADLVSDNAFKNLYMPFEPFIPAASIRLQ